MKIHRVLEGISVIFQAKEGIDLNGDSFYPAYTLRRIVACVDYNIGRIALFNFSNSNSFFPHQ